MKPIHNTSVVASIKVLHRKRKTEQQVPHSKPGMNSGASEGKAVPAALQISPFSDNAALTT